MIQQPTLEFLSELAENNNRDWFMANKTRYEAARENVVEFTDGLIKLIHKIDPALSPDLEGKKCVMRIYRDIRFSKNKTPYKNNFGISLPTTGTKLGGAEYYLHIQPGKSFIAGGYWMPEANHLKAIRQEIDYNADDLKTAIDAPEFKKLFGEFRDQEKLKTVPGGYTAGDENIDLLKLKNFAAVHPISDADLQKKDVAVKIVKVFEQLYPLLTFLNNAIS